MALITHTHKERICKRLLGYDKDIVEIIQFGSSVYAPEYALDVDLLVITRDKKEYGGYLDCLADFDFTCDVVVREVGEKVKSGFACNILGAFEILYGKGEYLKEMTEDFEPRFREARSYIRGAKEDMDMARVVEDADDNFRHFSHPKTLSRTHRAFPLQRTSRKKNKKVRHLSLQFISTPVPEFFLSPLLLHLPQPSYPHLSCYDYAWSLSPLLFEKG